MKKVGMNVSIIAAMLLFASINATAKVCDIKKIIGFNLGDKVEKVLDWAEKNNLERWPSVIAIRNNDLMVCTGLNSWPANNYHFEGAKIYSKNNLIEEFSIAIDANHPENLEKLLRTWKMQANSFDEDEDSHILTIYFDNCLISIKTELEADEYYFWLNIRVPEKK